MIGYEQCGFSTSSMSGAPSDDAGRLMARINERLEVACACARNRLSTFVACVNHQKKKKKIPKNLIFNFFFICESNLRAN
jgi:hypothetical protein